MASPQATGQVPPWQPAIGPPPRKWGNTRLKATAIAGVVFGLVGITIGVTALVVRPEAMIAPTDATTSPEPSYSADQTEAAKEKICVTFVEVRKGVEKNSQLEALPGPEKELYDYVASAQARLALVAGSESLKTHLDPATPMELAGWTRQLADAYVEKATATLAGITTQDARWQPLDQNVKVTQEEVERLCR